MIFLKQKLLRSQSLVILACQSGATLKLNGKELVLGWMSRCPSQGNSVPRFMFSDSCNSVSVGGKISLSLSKANGSMSVLMPGPDPLLHRACIDEQEWYLLEWFSTVVDNAWEAINAAYSTCRPEKIFLVTGQTLTSEYSISHQEQNSIGCEINVNVESGIPSLVDAHAFLSNGCTTATASFGFEVMKRKLDGETSVPCYSIYFETYESFPSKRFQNPNLSSRLRTMYRYEFVSICPNN